MLCPQCSLETRIGSVRTQVTGDDSPAAVTRVETVQSMYCRNPQCAAFNTQVAENRVLLYESDPAAATEQEV